LPAFTICQPLPFASLYHLPAFTICQPLPFASLYLFLPTFSSFFSLSHFLPLMPLALAFYTIIKRVSWFKSSLLLRIKMVDITNINF
jgi:hypothetical protein